MQTTEKHLHRRQGTYYLKRRVPVEYRGVEPKVTIWKSLKTDSLSEAKLKALRIWDELTAMWEAKLAGRSEDAIVRFDAVQALARKKGFTYLPLDQVIQLDQKAFYDRVLSITENDGKLDLAEARAILGVEPPPGINISTALELYWGLSRDKAFGKSPDQLRRWKNPRKKTIQNFITLVGDKDISEITRADMLEFRTWWLDRIEFEGLTANSATKDFNHLRSILRTVNEMKELGLNLPFDKLSIQETKRPKRPGFSDHWIRDVLLKPGALEGLNAQARAIFIIMINTGARLSEIANLKREHIALNEPIPYMHITPVDRQLKTISSERKIPLLGCSLDAAESFPDGFPRYRDKPSLSATINSFLRENGLKETPEHTAYSLRHSFEDRLRQAHVDEKVRKRLFGHSVGRIDYGEVSLSESAEAIGKIAF